MSRLLRPPGGETTERIGCGPRSLRFGGSAVVALALALALAGAVLAAQLLTARTGGEPDPHAAVAAASARVSFGSLTIAGVRMLPGLGARPLAGVTHFPSYVPPTLMRVDVAVVLTDSLDRPVRYAPAQFRLRVRGARPAAAAAGSTAATVLRAGASLEGRLEFVVPRRPSTLRLEFRDPGRRRPLVIELGRANVRAVKKVETHEH
jgi:hypothetical protein